MRIKLLRQTYEIRMKGKKQGKESYSVSISIKKETNL